MENVFGHDLELQTGFTETSEPVLKIFPFCLALMRLKVFRVVNLQLLEILNKTFIFEIFEISTDGPPVANDGPPVDHRWKFRKSLATGGKLPCNLIFAPRWSSDGQWWT